VLFRSRAPKRTPLWEEHRKLTRKLVPFAGWEMPVWYTGIAEEHAAVRQAAGLFDIGHMGVLEVAGDQAVGFLDAVTTNHVADLGVGQCQYSFLLDLDGVPMDDVIVCRRAPQRFMVVVNAANADRVWAWLKAVNSGEYVLDRDRPHCGMGRPAVLQDLKAAEAGDDQRVALALQGPGSAAVLRKLRGESPVAGPLAALPWFGLIEGDVGGVPAIISRTGYAGERIGFELFVHPARVVELWRLILEAGDSLGVRPAGLGARDSTRLEAGLPLYGHELAGPHQIIPTGAGYGFAVRFHKPFFIGREAFLARERSRTMEVVRFQLDDLGTPAVRPDDPVASRRGEHAGWVTSCALVAGRQMGLAYVDRKLSAPGTPLAILPLRGPAEEAPSVPPADLAPGDRVLVSEKATVLPRFRR
jgi:glycine hydroxymethyltransferase